MKLIRFGEVGKEKPGLLHKGQRVDVSAIVPDYNEDFFQNDGLKTLAQIDLEQCPIVPDSVRLGPVVKRPSKFICIGINYKKHAKESGMELPNEPVVFFKAPSAMVGPNDDLILPKNSQKTDWEVELAIVIGKKASYIEKDHALDYIAGYCLHNDYSEREYQLERCGQWVKGKSCDSFAPLGPFLATPDEIDNVHNLRLWLSVNGVIKQDANTSDMAFNVPFLVAYLSNFMSLLPGDIISTGTPAGVGLGFKPPQYLKAGDVVELGIEGLGSSRQNCKAWAPSQPIKK